MGEGAEGGPDLSPEPGSVSPAGLRGPAGAQTPGDGGGDGGRGGGRGEAEGGAVGQRGLRRVKSGDVGRGGAHRDGNGAMGGGSDPPVRQRGQDGQTPGDGNGWWRNGAQKDNPHWRTIRRRKRTMGNLFTPPVK